MRYPPVSYDPPCRMGDYAVYGTDPRTNGFPLTRRYVGRITAEQKIAGVHYLTLTLPDGQPKLRYPAECFTAVDIEAAQ